VWLAGRDDVDRRRIAIGGASAGGGLTAAALLARERGAVRPVFQLLTYPMLDDRTTGRPSTYERDLRLWNTSSNRFGWTSYLGSAPGGAGVSGLAAPARACAKGAISSKRVGTRRSPRVCLLLSAAFPKARRSALTPALGASLR
jgi:acetyl esterase/lipase